MPILPALRLMLLIVLLWAGLASHALAAALPVDLELVLAVDVSRSIDDEEYNLQKRGYAEAFLNPAVINAIRSTPNQRIAVTMVEWASADQQRIVVPWTLVGDTESAAVLADAIMKRPRAAFGRTAFGSAIDFSAQLFGREFVGARRTIDVSGDGISNEGRSADYARDEAVKTGIVINGLVIMNDRPNPGFFGQPGFFFGGQANVPLDEYFRDSVIGGPGAFLIAIDDFQSFAYAIVNKLVREIAAAPLPPARVIPASFGAR